MRVQCVVNDTNRMSKDTCHTSHNMRHASYVIHQTSHVTCRSLHVTRHTSHVIRHTSHVTRHTSHVTSQALNGAASSSDVTGGSVCETSTWLSDSGVECKQTERDKRGGWRRRAHAAGTGAAVLLTFGLQQGTATARRRGATTRRLRAAWVGRDTGRRQDARPPRSQA